MKKILIAEDDPFLLKVYEAKVAKSGFEVKIAHDGEEVFTLLKDFTPDLILLDMVMPKKDGFEVLTELRAQPQLAKIPVIVTSNLGQPEDKQKAKDLGAIDYLVKSDVSIGQIIERINTFLTATPESTVVDNPPAHAHTG